MNSKPLFNTGIQAISIATHLQEKEPSIGKRPESNALQVTKINDKQPVALVGNLLAPIASPRGLLGTAELEVVPLVTGIRNYQPLWRQFAYPSVAVQPQ